MGSGTGPSPFEQTYPHIARSRHDPRMDRDRSGRLEPLLRVGLGCGRPSVGRRYRVSLHQRGIAGRGDRPRDLDAAAVDRLKRRLCVRQVGDVHGIIKGLVDRMREPAPLIALVVLSATASRTSHCRSDRGVRAANCYRAHRFSIGDGHISVSQDPRLATCFPVLSARFEE